MPDCWKSVTFPDPVDVLLIGLPPDVAASSNVAPDALTT